jgi:hypothetical protein
MLRDEALLDPAAHKPVMRSLVQLVRYSLFASSFVISWLRWSGLCPGFFYTRNVPLQLSLHHVYVSYPTSHRCVSR